MRKQVGGHIVTKLTSAMSHGESVGQEGMVVTDYCVDLKHSVSGVKIMDRAYARQTTQWQVTTMIDQKDMHTPNTVAPNCQAAVPVDNPFIQWHKNDW